MNESIFLLNNDGKLIEMIESGYISESHLQELLADNPNLISGSQINPGQPRKWLFVSREFGVPDEINTGDRWSLDHLFVDQDGIPTLVEVKRSTDTRIRREVIGQILDYAANAVVYWSVDEIKYRYLERCKALCLDPEKEMDDFLPNDTDAEKFWENTKTNLKAGKIRMLIIADSIPKEMQRIIEFLNGQMTPAEILALEIKQFVGEGLKTLVPRVLGLTAAAETTKGRALKEKGSWDEASFTDEILKKKGAKAVQTVKCLVEWAKTKNADIWYGSGTQTASLGISFKYNKRDFVPCFIIFSYGVVEMQFQHMKLAPFDEEAKKKELFDKLNAIPGVNISVEKITKRPPIPIATLAEENALEQFLAVFDWYVEEISPYF